VGDFSDTVGGFSHTVGGFADTVGGFAHSAGGFTHSWAASAVPVRATEAEVVDRSGGSGVPCASTRGASDP
jgi:hypothetical protein